MTYFTKLCCILLFLSLCFFTCATCFGPALGRHNGKAVPSSLALITALEVAITALSQEGSVKMMRKVAEAVFFSTSRRRQFLVHNPTCQPA